MELMIPLDSQGTTPMYEQIYCYIKEEIRLGDLKAGSRLPSTRVLADHLKVSRSTTQMAYEQLLSEGYIHSEPCKGYFVAAIEELVEAGEQPGPQFAEPFVPREEKGSESFAVDFSPRGIDLDSFPFNTWRKISRAILVDDNKALFLNGDPQGEYALRKAIRSYLHSARGVRCSADQIVVGAGNEYLLMLLSLLLGPDRWVAMENPTYKQAYRVFISQGYRVVPIEMDRYGMDIRMLRKEGAGDPEDPGAESGQRSGAELPKAAPSIAYVMPSHQYPMGIVMPIKRRQELLAWAYEEEDRYLIEDDYDSEFRYKGKPIPALQGMDRGERVIYIGTFSRSIAPAIRVGFLVLPPKLLELYKKKAGFFSSTVSRIDQNILYQFLTEGHYERHLNRMRSVYKGKHDCLLGELKAFEGKFWIRGENAGIHVLLTHKEGVKEVELEQSAARADVKVYGLSRYFIHPEYERYPDTVLLGYANLTEEKIREGCARLKAAWGL